MGITFSRGEVRAFVCREETGHAVDRIEAVYDGPDCTIGFNVRYLLDILAQIERETVAISFSDAASPVIVTGGDGTGALYVQMPMKLNFDEPAVDMAAA